MITFKLKRDEARFVFQFFIPYMEQVTQSRLQSTKNLTNEHLTCMVLDSLVEDVHDKFEVKLRSKAIKLTFNLRNAQGIAFYLFMMKQPIAEAFIYAWRLRQRICDDIHRQIIVDPLPTNESIDEAHYDYSFFQYE